MESGALGATEGTSGSLIARAEWSANAVSVPITLDGKAHAPVWFRASQPFGQRPDFLLPLTLLPAMATGSRLGLAGSFSPRLVSAVSKVQDILCLWGEESRARNFRGLQRVEVDVRRAGGRSDDRPSDVACFFSGGVDSFHTALKHQDEITHLIFVHGFDLTLGNVAIREKASQMAHEVAKGMGKNLIEVETNLRSFSNGFVRWGDYHGAALACVALLFQHRFRKVFIASTRSYANLVPWGSHPVLDPLWNTELTGLEHDGCEVTRPRKAAYISEYGPALEWLRVCLNPSDGIYNCGNCVKCLTTMLSLQAAGALERSKTFPKDLDLQAIAEMDLSGDTLLPLAQQILRALEQLETEPDSAEALAVAIARCPESSEARAEREMFQRELSKSSKRLESTRNKLKATRRLAEKLKTERDEKLAAGRKTPRAMPKGLERCNPARYLDGLRQLTVGHLKRAISLLETARRFRRRNDP